MSGGWRERLWGSRDRIGWWTVPVFAAVGLAGAVLAGALAVVYYGQQVNGLEEETRASREELRGAADEVAEARDDAVARIEEEVDRVEQALGDALPVEDAGAFGVAVIDVTVPVEPGPTSQPSPAPEPPPSPSPTGSPAALADTRGQAETERRTGSAFAVARDGDATFFATSYELVDDPDVDDSAVETVELATSAATVTAEVHSWDADRGLALLRADVGEVRLPDWRGERPLAPGDRVVALGLTPSLETIQVGASVTFADGEAIVTDLPSLSLTRGGPLVDRRGRVVGVVATEYLPFGSGAAEERPAVPVRLLCERLLRACPQP